MRRRIFYFSPIHDCSASNPFARRIDTANSNYERLPRHAAATLIGCEMGTIFLTHQFIVWSGIHVPAAFALGFALSRPFRRPRLPVEIAMAALLSRVAPELTRLKLTTLMAGVLPTQVKTSKAAGNVMRWKGAARLKEIVDKYGACYFIGARWTGVLSVLIFTGCLEAGVDLAPLMNQVGLNPEVGRKLGTWALAVTASSALYPFSVGFASVVATPMLGRFTARLKG